MNTQPVLHTARRARREFGGGAVEFSLLVVLVAVTVIASAKTLGETARGKLEAAEDHINGTTTVPPSACVQGNPAWPGCMFR
jgi:Flp pilus assembly pilin Flp